MGFLSLPRKAQVYLSAVVTLGIVAAITAMLGAWPGSRGTGVEIAAFLLIALVFGGKKITLIRHIGADDAVSMSLGFVITFAGMLRFGPTGAFALGALSCLSGCIYPKRQPLYQLVFNVSLSALEAFLGSLAYLAINGWTLDMRPVETFVAISGATLVYFAVNTGGVSIVIGICSGQKPTSVWRDTFLWTAPSYFAGACLSGLSMVLFGSNFWYILLFVAPVAYLTYQSYAVYSSRTEEKIRHAEEISQQHAKTADLYLATIKSLALAIDAKDQYTHQHILRVQRYAVAIAKQMGLTDGDLEAVNTGALLHDIGKLGVPEYVLLKPGRLTDEEFAKIKKHPEIGAAILDPVEFPWPVLPVVKYHHEKWDGTGYPEGLKGEEIPLTARIMAVADVYDALTSTRSYRNAWTHDRAYEVICKDVGTHFDAIVHLA
ncbi:MAG: HD-GYP domain-containing protein, partial [Chlorobia bacterium]|nr:HD-GYP domain-containing protein [Fimbriimonadaceae bacterium]